MIANQMMIAKETREQLKGSKRPPLKSIVACGALLLAVSPSLVRAQIDNCNVSDSKFANALKNSFEVSRGGADQQRAVSFLVEAVNSCGTTPQFMDALFQRADQVKDIKAVVALASILNVAKTPWKAGNADEQNAWMQKFYGTYKVATNDASKAVLNGALMNADGLYRQAVAKLQAAMPGTADFEAVRSGLQNTLQYSESPNYDDAKFLLAELEMRQLIAIRLGVITAPSPEIILPEVRRLLNELIESPKGKRPKYKMYAFWNLALLHLLAGEKDQSAERLESMNKVYNEALNDPNKLTWDHTLYYYRALHYPDFNVINNHITASELYTRWKAVSMAWGPGTAFTGRDGPRKLAAEIERVFKDTSTYFLSLGVFSTPDAAQKKLDELVSSGDTNSEQLMVYPPWADRNVFTIGTKLMTLSDARKRVDSAGSGFLKDSSITRFY